MTDPIVAELVDSFQPAAAANGINRFFVQHVVTESVAATMRAMADELGDPENIPAWPTDALVERLRARADFIRD